MDNVNNFEKIVLPEHQETLESVGREAAEKHVDYIGRGISKERRDVFKEVLNQRATPTTQSEPAQQLSSAVQSASSADVLKGMSQSEKLQELVNIAATKGPVEASLMARELNDPWLEDQFHDTLISFHDELVRRRKLKEE